MNRYQSADADSWPTYMRAPYMWTTEDSGTATSTLGAVPEFGPDPQRLLLVINWSDLVLGSRGCDPVQRLREDAVGLPVRSTLSLWSVGSAVSAFAQLTASTVAYKTQLANATGDVSIGASLRSIAQHERPLSRDLGDEMFAQIESGHFAVDEHLLRMARAVVALPTPSVLEIDEALVRIVEDSKDLHD